MNSSVKRLTTGAMLVALSTILSLLVLYELPYGGSVTVLCMLPVCVFAYMYGIKWGLLGGFTMGVLQFLLSKPNAAFASMSLADFFLMTSLDYIVAYTCLGLTSLGRGRFKSDRAGLTAGILIASTARLLSHALSGYILFRGYAEWYFSQDGFTFGAYILDHMSGTALSIFYAFFYNLSFLLPETVITVVGAILVVPVLKRFWETNDKTTTE